jgi:predicted nucleic-acid-binding Zn-ribbon protein
MLPENYLFGYGAIRLVKFGDVRGDNIVPSYCRNCGYIELYNVKNLKR